MSDAFLDLLGSLFRSDCVMFQERRVRSSDGINDTSTYPDAACMRLVTVPVFTENPGLTRDWAMMTTCARSPHRDDMTKEAVGDVMHDRECVGVETLDRGMLLSHPEKTQREAGESSQTPTHGNHLFQNG